MLLSTLGRSLLITCQFVTLVLSRVGVMRECCGNLSEIWINTIQHLEELNCNIFRRSIRARKVLQLNFEEWWTILIHTLDKIPSHSHCYQVNDCQFIYVKNIMLELNSIRQIWISCFQINCCDYIFFKPVAWWLCRKVHETLSSYVKNFLWNKW